jgi:hypothetical protein
VVVVANPRSNRGKPRILVDVDNTGKVNLKTGIGMPHLFERNGRYFVCYNIDCYPVKLV